MSSAWEFGDFASTAVVVFGVALAAVTGVAGVAGLGVALTPDGCGATGWGFAGVAVPLALFV